MDEPDTEKNDRLAALRDWTPPPLLLEETSRDRSTDRTVEHVLESVGVFAERWDLYLQSPYRRLTYNFVAPATSSEHGPVVLKIAFGAKKLRREYRALQAFGGHGAVRVLEYDGDAGAMLLEQAEPGRPMKLDWDACTLAFAGLAKELWQPASADMELPLATREANYRLGELRSMAVALTAGGFDARAAVVERAASILSELMSSGDEQFTLHGDLHPYNVLSATRAPWLSIDPLGCIGERAFDVCAILRDDSPEIREAADPQDMVDRRIRDLSSECGLDDTRVRAWSFVEAVRTQGWLYRTGKPLDQWSSIIGLLEP